MQDQLRQGLSALHSSGPNASLPSKKSCLEPTPGATRAGVGKSHWPGPQECHEAAENPTEKPWGSLELGN